MRFYLIGLVAVSILVGFSAVAQANPSDLLLASDTGDGVMSGAIRGGIIGGVVGGIAGVVMWALKKNKK